MNKYCVKCGSELNENGECLKCGYKSNKKISRVQIKEKAKEIVNNNFSKLIVPLLILYGISLIVDGVISIFPINGNMYYIISFVCNFFVLPLNVGLIYYYSNISKGKILELKEMFRFYKNIVPLFALSFMTSLFVALWSILFIIPGIIAALGYSLTIYIFIDNPERDIFEIMKESKRKMYGHKFEFFVFCLSFIGWLLLVAITFGIAIIYVGPYMTLAEVMYLEEVKKIES